MKKEVKDKRALNVSSLFTEGQKVNDNINYHTLRLIKFGFSTKAISARTGLSGGQISYRVRMYNLQGMRANYRNGETPISQQIMAEAIKSKVKDAQKEAETHEKIRMNILSALRKKK